MEQKEDQKEERKFVHIQGFKRTETPSDVPESERPLNRELNIIQDNFEGIRLKPVGLKFDELCINVDIKKRKDVDQLIEFLMNTRLCFKIQ